jgi:peptidoglycan/LPS O-acetylase OafA/YrhL
MTDSLVPPNAVPLDGAALPAHPPAALDGGLDKTAVPSATLAATRFAFIDLLRAVGSQLIVWHHLTFYGPLSDVARPLSPVVIDWLADEARMVVQLFFVVGGFVAARSLERQAIATPAELVAHLLRRFRRIAFPYLVTVVVAVGANELARLWMTHDSISAPPTLAQLLAHAVFLQDVLGYEALSAGIWYVAIDWQLAVLTALVLMAKRPFRRLGASVPVVNRVPLEATVFGIVAVLSLFWFNRQSELDAWAIYFVGSYYSGMVVQYALGRRIPRWWCGAYLGLMVIATVVEYRPRLLVATTVACLLWAAGSRGWMAWSLGRLSSFLGRISYSLFLIHFPVCLVVNAFWSRFLPSTPHVAAAGMLVAYALSLCAAVLLHRGVEVRVLRAGRSA